MSVQYLAKSEWGAGRKVRMTTIGPRSGGTPRASEENEHNLFFVFVLRDEGDSFGKIGFNLGVTGKRPKGRPKQRRMDTLHADLKTVGMHPDQAHDRTKWRQGISKADPVTKRDKR
ncbi:hypothetical protein Y032_0270g856 [Ancylostoma ceylanicum]|uniref:Uncharacterized protein n=1 Tax=Ancylostoma ceylanicum TaxID=53326 RepID=A0A016S8K3_9BILA|nr:hypothetical protein Y032_0270g856 [Ancylostoma ceylanicum]